MQDNVRILNNRYRLDECIGSGGMAEVYRAYDLLLDREVAVKILNKDLASDEKFIVRFKREAKAAGKLTHPCIVNVFDVGQAEDVNFIVMEFVGGGSLKQVIEAVGIISGKRAIKVAIDIATGLAHAHARGLVHCDVKSHNILVDKDGNAKIADFGVAYIMATASTATNDAVMGSVHYMAPEQVRGEPVNAQADIYSLGVVLFEMLAGRVPFMADTPMGVAVKQVNDIPPLVREFNPKVFPMLESIVSKALAKNKEDRYQNALEMVDELRRAEMLIVDEEVTELSKRGTKDQIEEKTETISAKAVKYNVINERMKKWIYALSIAILLVFGFAIGLFAFYGNFWSNAEVTVPNVIGKNQKTAEQVLAESKLRVKVEEDMNSIGPLDTVSSQNPEPGMTVKEGRYVTIVVNSSKDVVIVPDLMDLNVEQASSRITGTGLKLGSVKETFSDKVRENSVIGQSPIANSRVQKGTVVDIIITKREVRKIVVPNLSGLAISGAKDILNDKKLVLGSVSEIDSNQAPGSVLRQSPRAGAEVVENSRVDVVIAKPMGSKRVENMPINISPPKVKRD